MPEISRFFGIVIKMFFDDHNPPRFHAFYGEDQALIDIRNLAVFAGWLPPPTGAARQLAQGRRSGASS